MDKKTIREKIDCGELVLEPHKTKIIIRGIFIREATFLRHKEGVGYVFKDSYGELFIFEDSDIVFFVRN